MYAELSPFRQIFTGVVTGPHLQATKRPLQVFWHHRTPVSSFLAGDVVDAFMNLDSPFFLWFWVWSACGMRLRSRVHFPWLSSVMRSRAQQSALAAPRNGQRKVRRRTPCLLKCGGLGFQMFFAHPSEPTPSSTFRAFSTAWRTSSSAKFVQIGSHSDGDRFIPVLFFRLRQLPVSSHRSRPTEILLLR